MSSALERSSVQLVQSLSSAPAVSATKTQTNIDSTVRGGETPYIGEKQQPGKCSVGSVCVFKAALERLSVGETRPGSLGLSR